MDSIKNVELSEKLIFTNLDKNSNFEILKELSDKLLQNNYVKDGFYKKIIEREKSFPTGIKTKSIGIAIPHTQPEYVNKNTISVAILNKPVMFHEMTNEENTVEVKIVFLLALTDANKHINILQKLIEIIKDDKVLNSMLTMNKTQIVDLLDRYVNKN